MNEDLLVWDHLYNDPPLQLSTVVKYHDVPKVMESYARIMKSSMDGLKKVKKVKSKAKAVQG